MIWLATEINPRGGYPKGRAAYCPLGRNRKLSCSPRLAEPAKPMQTIKDAVLRLPEQDARFRGAVREGIAQADREEFIEEKEMDARIERMLNS